MQLLLARTARDSSATPLGSAAAGDLTLRRGRILWHVFENVFNTLCDEQGLKLNLWRRENRLELVKNGPHRTVFRVVLPEGCFYIKHYKCSGWRSRVRNLVRPGKALLEARAAVRVAAAGVPTVTPVAAGSVSSAGFSRDSYLVVCAIENTQSLHDFISSPEGSAQLQRNPAFRQQLARKLGVLAAQLHRAKLLHRDFHPGNILIRAAGPADLQLWLVDLHSVTSRRRLGLKEIERNLSLLNTFFDRYSSSADRLRFFTTYWSQLGECALSGGFPKASRRVEAYCLAAARRAYNKGDGKWLRPNRRIRITELPDRSCRAYIDFGTQIIGPVHEEPERLFREGRIRFWRRRTQTERLAAVDLKTETGTWNCYVRSRVRPRTIGFWKLSGRWTSTRRAWEIGHAFRRRGIPTPLPLLHAEVQSVASIREYLVTERIANALPLSIVLDHSLTACQESLRERWLRDYAAKLASIFRRLHACGFDHEALTADNVLVPSNIALRDAWLLGLDQVRKRRRLSANQVRRSLVQFHQSLDNLPRVRRTHRLRFLKHYLGQRFSEEWKVSWRNVERLSASERKRGDFGVGDRRAFLAASLGTVAALCSGCRTVEQPVALPARHSLRSDQLLVLSDFKLPQNHPLIEDLTKLRQDVAKSLDLPLERDPVVVYLFSNETVYRQYLEATYPRLPPRRAYFVGTPTELAVYTYWGDNIQEDLRHEYTHGLLHSSIRNVPIWIDEGLAEYFEVTDPGPARINSDYAQRLAKALGNGWRPDLRRLEHIDEFSKMQQVDYQESWAWVHFMLHSTPEARETLVSYLHDLKTEPHAQPLSTRLARMVPGIETRFLSHLASLPQARQLAGAF